MSSEMRKRGLGRGLNALFEDNEDDFLSSSMDDEPASKPSGSSASGPLEVGIELLAPSIYQPRKQFDEEALQELADSIRTHGLLQPILVRKTANADIPYEIIAGERRWRASQLAQLHQVPIIIKEISDTQAFEIALIENLQREDLSPVDEALGYQKLIKEYDYTHDKLGESLGKSRSHISNMMRLLSLPRSILNYLEEGKLSVGHARALITSYDTEALAEQVIKKGLSVRETEKLVAKSLADEPMDKPYKPEKDADTVAIENDLGNRLGMKVKIDVRGGDDGKPVVGKMAIEFRSLDQLDVLLKRLRSLD